MKHSIVLSVAVLLAGCAGQLLSDDYAGQTAVVKDSFANYGEGATYKSEHAELFAMVEVDGKAILNTRNDTVGASWQDRTMRLRVTERRVPIKPLKVTLVGLVYSPGALFDAADYETQKTVSFHPVSGETYVVRGKLGQSGSSVWIETAGGKRVTQ